MKLISKKVVNERIEVYELTDVLKVRKIYRHNKISSITLEGKGPHGSNPMIVKPIFWEFIKSKNIFQKYIGLNPDKPKDVVYGFEYCTYDKAEKNDFDYDQLLKDNCIVYWYGSANMIFDINGNPIPLVHSFDYSGTHFHNEDSDIDKVLQVLKKHKWSIEPEKLKIVDVPYYNNDSGNKRYIGGIQLLPSRKEYIKMYKIAIELTENNKVRKEFWSCTLKDLVHSHSFEKPDFDLLGIHKFLKIENSFHPKSEFRQNMNKKKK